MYISLQLYKGPFQKFLKSSILAFKLSERKKEGESKITFSIAFYFLNI